MGKSKHRHHDSDSDSADRGKGKKKKDKKVAKVAKMLGYSNDINPFGDSNLLTPFVWGKKKEEGRKEKKSSKKSGHRKKRSRRDDSSSSSSSSGSDSDSDGDSVNSEDRRLELLSEIEKVRKRRQDRENELAELERLRDEEQRLREMASFGDWQRKEEDFHLEQARERAKLRLCEYREKAIDSIVRNMLLIHTAKKALAAHRQHAPIDKKDLDFLHLHAELLPPGDVISRIGSLGELTELMDDIAAFEELDKQKDQMYLSIWPALRTVAVMHKKALQDPDRAKTALHASVVEDVRGLLRGKTVEQLDALEKDIRSHLTPGQALDVEYWELLLDEVVLQRAKADVLRWHNDLLQQWSDWLQDLRATSLLAPSQRAQRDDRAAPGRSKEARIESADELALRQYLKESKMDADSDNSGNEGGAGRNEEVQMSSSEEYLLPSRSAEYVHMGTKYQPRKPRYFNRVKTGWDRTKYNLAHYDSDNPPPKVIKGYKFTIFYPDLIDKSVTPKYYLEKCADSPNNDFVIIRFSAGPPYEDIAFKILNKEWDTHRRAGFLCVFDRGIMQLHFHFKRVFYRR